MMQTWYIDVRRYGSYSLAIVWPFVLTRTDICAVYRRVRKIAKSDSYLCHVSPSVYMEQLGSHWTNFDEILYLSFFIFCIF